MAKVLVIGATGETGLLVRALSEHVHAAYGLYRRPEQAVTLANAGAHPTFGGLLTATVQSLAEVIAGMDAVVFIAGSNERGDDQTDKIDGEGVVSAATAAIEMGVRRFLLVSAFPDAWRDRNTPADFEHYMFVKRQADVFCPPPHWTG